jgi:Family of unknown function (DUF6088)
LHLQENSGIFSCILGWLAMSQTFENKALCRIRGTGGGWAFSPRDFLNLGVRATVDSALHRLEKRGEIRRVIRGIYDYPRFSKLLDQSLSPDIDQVARALARKFRWRIQPSGATALNFLELSTQVPARAVYLSDGPVRVYQIGNTALVFEHTALKESGVELKESGLIVQALKLLGQERITPRSSRRFGHGCQNRCAPRFSPIPKRRRDGSTAQSNKSLKRSLMDRIAAGSASDIRGNSCGIGSVGAGDQRARMITNSQYATSPSGGRA